jgi:hypothetical protein
MLEKPQQDPRKLKEAYATELFEKIVIGKINMSVVIINTTSGLIKITEANRGDGDMLKALNFKGVYISGKYIGLGVNIMEFINEIRL